MTWGSAPSCSQAPRSLPKQRFQWAVSRHMSVQRTSSALSSPSLHPYSLGNHCLKSSAPQLKGEGGTPTHKAKPLYTTFYRVSIANLLSWTAPRLHKHLTAEVQILTELRDWRFLCSQMQSSQRHLHFTAGLGSFLSNLYHFMYSSQLSNALSIPLKKYPGAPDEPSGRGEAPRRWVRYQCQQRPGPAGY